MHRFCFFLLLLIYSGICLAQDKEIKGKVVSGEDGNPIAGAVVALKDTVISTTTLTDFDGNYRINLPAGGSEVLLFRYAGFLDLEVSVRNRSAIDVVMKPDLTQLNEIVVTGVAEGTPTGKLTFAMGKVQKDILEQVPAADAASALRGKIAGVTVVQGSGLPGTTPAIRLRGVTSIQGGEAPLIIVDGQITQGGLEDFNMQDVERIEVIKGAAAASLYGSRAGNGVIQIVTRKGSQTNNKTSVTVRNEVGFTNLQRHIKLATHHYYKLNPDGTFLTRDSIFPDANDPEKIDTISNRVPQDNLVLDQPFTRLYDQQKQVFQNRLYYTNYVQLASTGDKTTLLASFENMHNEGVVAGFQAYSRRNVRVNIDHRLSKRLKISITSLYSKINGPLGSQRSQSGIIYGTLLIDPDLNLKDRNPDGTAYRAFYKDRGDNANNPLYEANNLKYNTQSDRVLANLSAEYKLAGWWRMEGQYSIDNNFAQEQYYKRKGYLNISYPTGDPGNLSKSTGNSSYQVGTLSSYFNKQFGSVKASLSFKYQYEKSLSNNIDGSGTKFTVSGVPQFQAFSNANITLSSTVNDIRSENYFTILHLDIKDKIILEGVARRDGSSLFGPETRYRNFYRMSGAYRVSEDVKIKGIDDWKVRVSYGTSGSRPPSFSARYDIYELSNGNSLPLQLANPRLKPSLVAELEYGTNIYFLNRFSLEFNHAVTHVKDNILRAPVPSFTGNSYQYQNNSQLRTRTYEFALDARLLEKEKWKWNIGLVGSTTKQVIQQLTVPLYATDDGSFDLSGSGPRPFRIQQGVSIGAIYGNVIAKSASELKTDASGFVSNVDRQPISGILKALGMSQEAPLRPDNFEVNDQGYLIFKNPMTGESFQYTPNERAIRLLDEGTGRAKVAKIGDALPKFVSSFRSTINYRSISLYFLFDTQWGGDVYNYTKQLLYFNLRAADLDQTDRPSEVRHSTNYFNGSLYNGGNPVNYFVEKGSFTSLREFNISYNISKKDFEKLWKLGNFFYDARISFIGRNIVTFTKYSGYNPEVTSSDNSTVYRMDNFSFPIFRTFSCALQMRF